MRIGIDLGGTKIEAVLMDQQGRILERNRVATPQHDYSGTLQAIRALVDRLEQACRRVCRVGIATPGAISKATGAMKNCNSICLNGRFFLEDISRLLNRKIRVANDADCFVLSEATDGAGTGYGTVFGAILGTGVGGGICIKKELLQGVNRITGAWGHNPVAPLGGRWAGYDRIEKHCHCGRINCIESWLCGPAFEQCYEQLAGRRLLAAEIVALADSQDNNAMLVLDLYQEHLARSLASVINLLDPDLIVLGGGMSNVPSLYSEVSTRWSNYVFSDICETDLLQAKHGDSSGVRGAAWLWGVHELG